MLPSASITSVAINILFAFKSLQDVISSAIACLSYGNSSINRARTRPAWPQAGGAQHGARSTRNAKCVIETLFNHMCATTTTHFTRARQTGPAGCVHVEAPALST